MSKSEYKEPAIPLTGKPPYFRCSDPVAIDQWLELGFRLGIRGQDRLKESEREMLLAWRELAEGGEIFDLASMHAALDSVSGKSRSQDYVYRLLHKVITPLAEAGIVWRERARGGGKNGRSLLLTLRTPDEVASAWQGPSNSSQDNPAIQAKPKQTRKVSNVPAKTDHIEATYQVLDTNGYFHPPAEKEEPWTVHLISQLIERCSRASARDQINHISSTISLGGELVSIDVSRVHHQWEDDHEYGIITADDSQVILAIMTLAMQTINADLQRGRNPTNRVNLDLLELSKMLGRGAERPLYRVFQKGMARIINTEFVMEMNPEGNIAKRLSESTGQPASRIRLRLVENTVEGSGEADVNGSGWQPRTNMRYFSFSLHPLIWQGLVAGQGWIVHPALLYERSGLTHKIYNHLRSQAGIDKAYSITGEDLMVILNYHHGANLPKMRTKFCERLWALFQESAALGNALLAPAMIEAGMPFNFFDLELSVRPNNRHKNGITIEARQSAETLQMLKRQEDRARALMQNVNSAALLGRGH